MRTSNRGDCSQSSPCSQRMNHTAMPIPPTQQNIAAAERGFPPSYIFASKCSRIVVCRNKKSSVTFGQAAHISWTAACRAGPGLPWKQTAGGSRAVRPRAGPFPDISMARPRRAHATQLRRDSDGVSGPPAQRGSQGISPPEGERGRERRSDIEDLGDTIHDDAQIPSASVPQSLVSEARQHRHQA